MAHSIINLWKNHGFEILFAICIIFITIASLYRKLTGKKGTWTKYSTYTISKAKSKSRKKRGPPLESKGEIECRKVLQQLFGKPFNKARPNFLSNPVTGGHCNLELDCFDSDLRIAVEYNGVQHYKYIPYMHKNKEGFLNQKYRDDMKRRICKDNKILLIEVPYTVNVEDIKKYIEKELRINGVEIKPSY